MRAACHHFRSGGPVSATDRKARPGSKLPRSAGGARGGRPRPEAELYASEMTGPRAVLDAGLA